ncbi:MAG: hypothetical protein HW416_3772 [Chloroflexi bacterium]|nr:hypothetical protein [Chloroflexota bacterium]
MTSSRSSSTAASEKNDWPVMPPSQCHSTAAVSASLLIDRSDADDGAVEQPRQQIEMVRCEIEQHAAAGGAGLFPDRERSRLDDVSRFRSVEQEVPHGKGRCRLDVYTSHCRAILL